MWFLVLGCAPPSQDTFEKQVFELSDTSREVPELGNNPSKPSRDLQLHVWSDASDAPDERPLILLAHGMDGLPEKFDRFARLLAAEGYVVASPRFPATYDGSGLGYAALADLANQPGDLDFTYAWLTDAADDPAHALYRRYDPENLGLIGHSLGAATALAWGHYPCCRSQSVRASVLSAPPYALVPAMFSGVPEPGLPTVIVHGDRDTTVSPSESADLADDLDELARVLLPDTGHSDAIESQEPLASQDLMLAVAAGLYDEVLKGEAGALEAALP